MQRYDRQVRLWSDSGQQDLAAAHVLAIGRSLAMLECLKNLALAGVGHLVLDLPERSAPCFLDNPKAPLADQLQKMNPQLQFESKNMADPDLILVVRGIEVPEHLREKPQIILESALMDGSIELKLTYPLPVLHSHPPSGLADLRFDPWPEYQEFCNSFDLDTLNEFDFRHVPFAVLIVKAKERGPNVEEELKNLQRYHDEDNFQEAFDNLHRLRRESVPQGVKELIEFSENGDWISTSQTETSLYFWKCMSGLSTFVNTHQRLPVSGEIPDMTSDSKTYVQLKEIYRKQARKDAQTIAETVTDVPQKYIEDFCRNCRFAKVLSPNLDNKNRTKKLKLDPDQKEKHQKEEKQSELPPVASLIGGMAAQEATKVLTGHYLPINGRLFFKGDTQETNLEANSKIIN